MTDATAPIDTSVRLPKAVVAASQRADEIHKASQVAGGTPPAPKPTNPSPAPAKPAEAAPTAPANGVPPPTDEDWQHRFNSAQGRLRDEQQKVSQLSTRVASLEKLLAEQTSRPQPAPAPPSAAQKRLITEAEEKEYTPDFIDFVKRAALEAAAPVIEQTVTGIRQNLDKELGPLKSTVQSVEGQSRATAADAFRAQLTEAVPEWRSLNTHPKFLNWLDLTDPASGDTRRKLLRDAFAQGNLARTAWFFKEFLRANGSPVPADTSQPSPAPPGKVSLEALAAPGAGSPAGAPTPSGAPDGGEIISRAQISQFYKNRVDGVYRGREKEAEALEQRIFAAEKAGRIR